MRPDTKRHYYFGLEFVIAPAPVFSPASLLKFEQRLADPNIGITFDQRQRDNLGNALYARQNPPLQLQLSTPAQQIGQIAVASVEPRGLPSDFVSDARDIEQAFRDVWSGPFQVVHRACTIRYLYASSGEHSFKYLWERRLHQAESELELLQRPILGGGIRLVLPARDGVQDDPLIEVKVESLLRDPSQLFVETQFAWQRPMAPGTTINPQALVDAVEEYQNGPVTQFLLPEQNNG